MSNTIEKLPRKTRMLEIIDNQIDYEIKDIEAVNDQLDPSEMMDRLNEVLKMIKFKETINNIDLG